MLPDNEPDAMPTEENTTPQAHHDEQAQGDVANFSSAFSDEEAVDEEFDLDDETDDADADEVEVDGSEIESASLGSTEPQPITRKRRRKKRSVRTDAVEFRLVGRRALCKKCDDIAPFMQRIVKNRLLKDNPFSRKMEDDELTALLRKESQKYAAKDRVINAITAPDELYDRGELKLIIIYTLLQEETFSCEEKKLDDKIIEYEKYIVKKAKSFDWSELKKQDETRWHHLDTYKIVLEAAWNNDKAISLDEANLLSILRDHLNIPIEEHWLISTTLKRFPKEKSALHGPDEIDEARKQLQRDGILWSYRDESNRDVDTIPNEIASVIRSEFAHQELQSTNYRRLLSHDNITVNDLRSILQRLELNRYGNKSELIERIIYSNIRPSLVLNELDKEKLVSMCAAFRLRSYGNKPDLIQSLVEFYDDLTFEERTTKDDREDLYNNYELLSCRAYAELRAKKVITKDLEIERLFEDATEFLFKQRLRVPCDRANRDNRADGRIPLDNGQSILWDCKSVEAAVNLQDHLEPQFDSYLRKEKELGRHPIAFLVIAPCFTPQSVKLALQYKAKTNWDLGLVTAEGLKHLAERWSGLEPTKSFPIRLLNQTALIDKERAEYLLSLA